MSFKKNMKLKRKLDSLLQRLLSTIREPPGKWWLDKDLVRALLDMTDFKYIKARDLNLYIRPLEGEIMEVVVFDNKLAIYHSTVDDIALRRSPYRLEVFSIGNIKKIMNDKDILVSKGKESLKRLHANALALLDLLYTGDDLTLLLEDARSSLEEKSAVKIMESLDIYFAMLDFQRISFGFPGEGLQVFAKSKLNGSPIHANEFLVLFNENTLSLALKDKSFSPEDELNAAWVLQYERGEKIVEHKGIAVFEFLSGLASEKVKTRKIKTGFKDKLSFEKLDIRIPFDRSI